MEIVWVAVGQVALPVIVGGSVVALSPRWPGLALHPLRTALGLYVLLVILTALAAPGLDMWVPLVGLESAAVAIGVYVGLQRRRALRR